MSMLEFIPVLLFVNAYIGFHANNCKLTVALPYTYNIIYIIALYIYVCIYITLFSKHHSLCVSRQNVYVTVNNFSSA